MSQHQQSIIRPPPPRHSVSILNFDRTAQEFVINEPASIEAMKRLGIRPNDVISKPLQSFVKNGCDETVTKYFYAKWNEGRNSLIEQIRSKRAEILNEKGESAVESAAFRREMIMINIDKQRIIQIDKSGDDILRHIFVKHLREIQRQKLAENDYNKTMSRAIEIQKQQTERIQTARLNANNFVFKSREKPVEQATFRDKKADEHEERKKALMERIAKQRKEEWNEKEKQIQTARRRSEELFEEKQTTKMQNIEKDEQRLNTWRSQMQAARLTRSLPKTRSFEEISQTLKQREEERRNSLIKRIKEKEEKFEGNKTKIIEETKSKYLSISLLEQEKLERTTKTRTTLEKEKIDKREKFIKEAEIIRQQSESMRSKNMLKEAEKIILREEKISQAQRNKLALEYESIRSKQPLIEDQNKIFEAEKERMQVNSMRTGAQIRIAQRKERLIGELHNLSSFDDQKTLRNIKQILNASDEEMNSIISSIKSDTRLQ